MVVMTMPRSGTEWMREIMWTMLHNPDLTRTEGDAILTQNIE